MFTQEEKDNFLENLSVMIASGIDLSSAIAFIRQETHSKKMLIILQSLEVEIDSGSQLWKALSKVNLLPDQS